MFRVSIIIFLAPFASFSVNTNTFVSGPKAEAAFTDTIGVREKVTPGGTKYKLWESKKGKKVSAGIIFKFHYVRKLNDSIVISSYETVPYYSPVESPEANEIKDILTSLKEGDSVEIAAGPVTATVAIAGTEPTEQVTDNGEWTTTVKILKVFDNEEDSSEDEEEELNAFINNEADLLKQYLKRKKIKAIATANGTWVEIIKAGKGTPVKAGTYIKVKYTGTTLGGRKFDSNIDNDYGHTEPLEFTVGKGLMIKGFDEGLQFLNEGSKARIYIPSNQGYWKTGAMPAIKPFETTVYYVEVLEVSKKGPGM